jgi:hypothetical protein
MLYKILESGKSCHGGNLEWSLPKKDGKKWIPGDWHEVKGNIDMCKSGIHLTDKPHKWYTWKCELFEAEADGVLDGGGDDAKCVCRKARLIKPVPHPDWWIKCHEFVEKEISAITWFQPDGKPIKQWKLYEEKTLAAAWDAAWAAARDAAWDAAWAAAWDATRDAAWAAARDAAWAAARDAAWDAAWAAAWAAARAAAWDATWAAARAAAWAATLYVRMLIASDLKLDPKYVKHIKARWNVWKKGYGLLCDVKGVLHVYGVKK